MKKITLKKYIQAKGLTYADFGKLVGTSGQYIYHLTSGFRKPGPELARRIEEVTGGIVGKDILRPDLWSDQVS